MLKAKFVAFFSIWLLAGTVQAGLILDDPILDEPILGGALLVAEDGNVLAEFLGSNAGYFNTLYLETVSERGEEQIFNKKSELNSLSDLGYFTAGTELIFRLYVRNTNLNFFTGSAARNPDGLAHALAITTIAQGSTYLTTVGFEDLRGGGDLDYNDFMFSLTNVIDPPPAAGEVPVPSVLMLMGAGLAGAGLVSNRRRRGKAAVRTG